MNPRRHELASAATILVAGLFATAARGGLLHIETERTISGIDRLTNRDKRVSVKFESAPALKVLEAVAAAGGFELKYAGPTDCCVISVELSDVTVRQALEAVAEKGDVDYQIVDSATVRVQLPQIVLPVLLTKSEPIYPKDARNARIQGNIILSAVIREDGTVSDVRVVRGVANWPSLDESAITAVRNRTYRPGTKDGVPVAIDFTIRVDFRLRDSATIPPGA